MQQPFYQGGINPLTILDSHVFHPKETAVEDALPFFQGGRMLRDFSLSVEMQHGWPYSVCRTRLVWKEIQCLPEI
jgi:hypothetical protein